MLEKIGVHWNDSNNVIQRFKQWPMPFVVLKDHSPDAWRACKEMSPQTIFVGRVTPDEGQDWTNANPAHEAQLAYERIMPMAERMREIVDFFIQWNEPVIGNDANGWREMVNYSDATMHLTELLARQDVRSAVGGFAEGNPRLSFWEYFLPALTLAMELKGIAHVHEYDWPYIGATMPWRTLRLSQLIFGNWQNLDTDPLDEWPGLPTDLFNGLTWGVTEFGLDRGEGIRKGWKTATQNDPVAYIDQVDGYNKFWLRKKEQGADLTPPAWDNLAGIAIFAEGDGMWKDYSITEDTDCYDWFAANATPEYYDMGNITPEPPVEPTPPEDNGMITINTQRRPMVGLHLRNDTHLTDMDHVILETAGIEAIKTMTNMLPEEIIDATLTGMPAPDCRDTIVRIYEHGHPGGVSNFVAKYAPMLRILGEAGIHKIEVLNEPNHHAGIEGWGSSDAHAADFSAWFSLAAPTLREAVPNIEIGFPGLAVPGFVHHDLRWLNICRPTILQHADWLGAHCYWQHSNRTADAWGYRFRHYHDRFPHMPIHITEFGDSTPNLDPVEQGIQIMRYYQQIEPYDYLKSAHAFIQSSPDPQWGFPPFSWTHHGPTMGPVVDMVGAMERGDLYTHTDGILKGYQYIGDQLAQHPTKTYGTRPLSMIKNIIIHHTAIPHTVGPKRISTYHVESKDYAGIGYHFFQPRHIRALQTQSCSRVSAHTWHHNYPSIGIGVAGMFQTHEPPYDQISHLAHLCADLIRALPNLDPGDIKGHHEMSHNHSNACPGRTWKRRDPYWRPRLINMVVSILED